MKNYLFGLLVIFIGVALFTAACAPQTQERTEPKPREVNEVQPSQEAQFDLLGNTLNVPNTDSTVAVATPFLQGELVPFTAGQDKGTVRLLSQGLSVRQEGEFLVLPVEVLRVSGSGGLYLLLLEKTGATYAQRDAQPLGKRVSLLSLELTDTLISATTVDSRLGKAPDFEVSSGGVARFTLQGGKLERVPE